MIFALKYGAIYTLRPFIFEPFIIAFQHFLRLLRKAVTRNNKQTIYGIEFGFLRKRGQSDRVVFSTTEQVKTKVRCILNNILTWPWPRNAKCSKFNDYEKKFNSFPYI